VDQAPHVGLARRSGNARCRLNMGRAEGLAAVVLPIEADGVDDPVRAGGRATATEASSCTSAPIAFRPIPSGLKSGSPRSGWHVAAHTLNPWSSKCRTTRRPRKPVPPRTVTPPVAGRTMPGTGRYGGHEVALQ
jgi:hypothetical protein